MEKHTTDKEVGSLPKKLLSLIEKTKASNYESQDWFSERDRKFNERKWKGNSGFTLVELLVVVAVIGLLALVAIPTFLSQRGKAQDASAKSTLKNTMSHYYAARQLDISEDSSDVEIANKLEANEEAYAFTPGTASVSPETVSVQSLSTSPPSDVEQFFATSESGYLIFGSRSDSGKTFCLVVPKETMANPIWSYVSSSNLSCLAWEDIGTLISIDGTELGNSNDGGNNGGGSETDNTPPEITMAMPFENMVTSGEVELNYLVSDNLDNNPSCGPAPSGETVSIWEMGLVSFTITCSDASSNEASESVNIYNQDASCSASGWNTSIGGLTQTSAEILVPCFEKAPVLASQCNATTAAAVNSCPVSAQIGTISINVNVATGFSSCSNEATITGNLYYLRDVDLQEPFINNIGVRVLSISAGSCTVVGASNKSFIMSKTFDNGFPLFNLEPNLGTIEAWSGPFFVSGSNITLDSFDITVTNTYAAGETYSP